MVALRQHSHKWCNSVCILGSIVFLSFIPVGLLHPFSLPSLLSSGHRSKCDGREFIPPTR